MRSRSRTLGSFLLLQALFLALGAFGGPVLPDETIPAPLLPELPTELGRVAPAGASTLQSGAASSDGIAHPVTTSARRQNSDVAAGAEFTPPQPPGQVHQTTSDPTRARAAAPRPQTGASSVAPGRSIDDDLDPELKEAAKAALQWVQEARERFEPARADQVFEATARSASAPVGGAAGSPGDMRSTPMPREYQATPPPGHPIGPSTGAELDPIRAAIKLVKDIVGHPLTWLLLVLVALGSVGVAFLKFQSRVASRRFRRHAPGRQPGSSPRGERRPEGRLANAAATPPPARRPDQKSARPKVRHTGRPR